MASFFSSLHKVPDSAPRGSSYFMLNSPHSTAHDKEEFTNFETSEGGGGSRIQPPDLGPGVQVLNETPRQALPWVGGNC